jgi:hypothetical protein
MRAAGEFHEPAAAEILMTLRTTAALLLVLALASGVAGITGIANANSVYSVGGLGEPSLEEEARLRAMGGAGVGESGPDQFSLVNPASISQIRHLILQGTILPTHRRITADGQPSEGANETTFPSLRGLVRLPGALVLGGAYAVGTDAEFRIDRPESAGTSSRLQIDGSGGLQFIRLTLARSFGSTLRFGLDHEIVTGTYREEWTRDFADTSLATSRDTLEVRYRKLGRWRLGSQATLGKWTLGAVYETARRLPVSFIERAAGTSATEHGRDLTIPSGVVVGATGSLTSRWNVAAQYRRANWKRSSLQSDFVDFRAMQRYSLGFERVGSTVPGAGWRDRLPLRFGVTYLEWPDLLPLAGQSDITGGIAGVNEWTLSLGTGILTQDKGGRLDLSLEAGQRGSREDLGVNERYVRAAITLTVSDDTWK